MRASLLILALGATAGAAVTAEPTKEQLEFFESKVRPILADRCYSCHSLEQGKSKGGLTLDMYGPGSTALGCLMAARLVEKGVRMVQTYYGKGDPWDAHNDIMTYRKLARDSDQAYAALIKDLKQRGLFQDTLIVGATEFGRTPAIQTANENVAGVVNGRDHNQMGFSIWLAGGGVKGGMTWGATDEFGFKAIENKVHIHDLHATMLYLLGIDHTKLTYQYSGRNFRLTDVAGEVIHGILA